MRALINLHLLLHSWIWSEIWDDVVWQSEVNRSVPVSYQMGNWKCIKKSIARALKSQKECCGSSIYHLEEIPMRVLWNSHRRIEPSIKQLEEYHRWKVITWFLGSSPGLPSNLGISEGNLTGIAGQEGSWWIKSLINMDKSRKSNVAKNGNCWLGCGYW